MDSCLSRTWKLSSLKHLAPDNVRSRALQTEVELQYHCLQLMKLKSTTSSLQKNLIMLEQELDNYCSKTKVATKEVLGKWRAKFEALQDNLKAAEARNAEQEQLIEVLKQELADLNVKAAKKGEATNKMEKLDKQLRSEFEQLEQYNQYLADDCQKKILID